MPHEFKLERRVEFADTDMAGIVHFSNYFRYMEATEHAFFRSLGCSLHTDEAGAMRGWARVHAECDYARPLRYQDVVEIHLTVRGKSASALDYAFSFRLPGGRADVRPGAEVARGAMRVVCVARDGAESPLRACPIPADVAELVDVAPETPPQAPSR